MMLYDARLAIGELHDFAVFVAFATDRKGPLLEAQIDAPRADDLAETKLRAKCERELQARVYATSDTHDCAHLLERVSRPLGLWESALLRELEPVSAQLVFPFPTSFAYAG